MKCYIVLNYFIDLKQNINGIYEQILWFDRATINLYTFEPEPVLLPKKKKKLNRKVTKIKSHVKSVIGNCFLLLLSVIVDFI